VNSGLSLNGTLYCYRNPLASNGEKLRNPWYDTTCCPPNLDRLFESLPGYLYATSRDGVYVNLYATSELDWQLEGGGGVKLSQSTGYPWTGDVKFTVDPERASEFTLYLRWPAWASSAEIQVNGQTLTGLDYKRGSYIPLSRRWQRGDTVAVSFPVQNVPMVSNSRVADTYGKVAMQRGPLVYALEQIDQGGVSLGDISARPGGSSTAEARKDLLGGITVLKISGLAAEKSTVDEPLYQPLSVAANRAKHPISLTFIPYYTVGNREPCAMQVWVPLARPEALTAVSVLGSASDGRTDPK
jgi:uncharacterized protein